MDGAAGYLKNLGVKNARQPVEEKIFNMFRSGTQSKQTNILDTHKKKRNIQIYCQQTIVPILENSIFAVFFSIFKGNIEGLGKTKLSISLRASH